MLNWSCLYLALILSSPRINLDFILAGLVLDIGSLVYSLISCTVCKFNTTFPIFNTSQPWNDRVHFMSSFSIWKHEDVETLTKPSKMKYIAIFITS